MSDRTRPRILHVSADFPDPISDHKTPVIARWLDLNKDRFDHRVISINRRTPGVLDMARSLAAADAIAGPVTSMPDGVAIEYAAPPLGLMHGLYLERLGDWIAEQARRDGTPELIVGHKLTIEGIAVAKAAKRLGVPYALTLQGNTDGKILRARPDLHRRLREIYQGAKVVFAMAPWTAALVEKKLGPRDREPVILPCSVGEGFPVTSPQPGRKAFVTAFNLRDFRVKNFAGLVRAMECLADEDEAPPLRVAGGGDPRSWRIVQSIVKPAPGIALLGNQTSAQLAQLMNESVALVLPSRRESFGLVLIEALRSGCPIIYPQGAAIAGYFDECSFAIPVDTRNPRAIAEVMRHAEVEQDSLKADLREWQERGGLDRFSKDNIAAQFTEGLESALSQ